MQFANGMACDHHSNAPLDSHFKDLRIITFMIWRRSFGAQFTCTHFPTCTLVEELCEKPKQLAKNLGNWELSTCSVP